ncbi:hypothetical protein LCGC14_1917800 [marine sediment metagenome]|uniref:Putative regulatory protein FmdB zinc ribbon domain-containing protein n=1 Tax=marine sediment metagenome TaxID=412755 RepID=A0A0F9FSF4_9ZZZZ
MPLYDYTCDDCKCEYETFQRIKDESIKVCPICGSPTYHRVPTLPNTPMKEFQTPIEMNSVAMTYHQDIVDFKRQNPDVECSHDPKDPLYGVPIAKSRQEKLKVLDKVGFCEKN